MTTIHSIKPVTHYLKCCHYYPNHPAMYISSLRITTTHVKGRTLNCGWYWSRPFMPCFYSWRESSFGLLCTSKHLGGVAICMRCNSDSMVLENIVCGYIWFGFVIVSKSALHDMLFRIVSLANCLANLDCIKSNFGVSVR